MNKSLNCVWLKNTDLDILLSIEDDHILKEILIKVFDNAFKGIQGQMQDPLYNAILQSTVSNMKVTYEDCY